jgi:hypothetical protein
MFIRWVITYPRSVMCHVRVENDLAWEVKVCAYCAVPALVGCLLSVQLRLTLYSSARLNLWVHARFITPGLWDCALTRLS